MGFSDVIILQHRFYWRRKSSQNVSKIVWMFLITKLNFFTAKRSFIVKYVCSFSLSSCRNRNGSSSVSVGNWCRNISAQRSSEQALIKHGVLRNMKDQKYFTVSAFSLLDAGVRFLSRTKCNLTQTRWKNTELLYYIILRVTPLLTFMSYYTTLFYELLYYFILRVTPLLF